MEPDGQGWRFDLGTAAELLAAGGLACEAPTFDLHPATRRIGGEFFCHAHTPADYRETAAVTVPGGPPDGPGLDDAQASRALGVPASSLALWRGMGFTWHWRESDPQVVQVWSGGALVGLQRLGADGRPAGPYLVVVNELTDAELDAARTPPGTGAAGQPVAEEGGPDA